MLTVSRPGSSGSTTYVYQGIRFYYDSNPYIYGYGQNLWGRLALAALGTDPCSSWREMYSYTAAGLKTGKRVITPTGSQDLQAIYSYNGEGQVASVQYPYESFPVYTYSFDAMGRPIGLTDNQETPVQWVKDVAYNVAGQITTLYHPEVHPRPLDAQLLPGMICSTAKK